MSLDPNSAEPGSITSLLNGSDIHGSTTTISTTCSTRPLVMGPSINDVSSKGERKKPPTIKCLNGWSKSEFFCALVLITFSSLNLAILLFVCETLKNQNTFAQNVDEIFKKQSAMDQKLDKISDFQQDQFNRLNDIDGKYLVLIITQTFCKSINHLTT